MRNVVREHPQIRRISLAVLVDEIAGHPRPPEELARIAALVKSAVGYDEKRGDHVEVVAMKFAAEPAPAPARTLLGLQVETPDVMRLAETGLIGLLGLVALLFVLRPTMLRIVQASTAVAGGGALALAGGGGGGGTAALTGAADVRMLAGPDGDGAEAMVAVANIDGHIRASSVRRLAELVEKHPEESLSIVRTWMQGEAA